MHLVRLITTLLKHQVTQAAMTADGREVQFTQIRVCQQVRSTLTLYKCVMLGQMQVQPLPRQMLLQMHLTQMLQHRILRHLQVLLLLTAIQLSA